MLQTRSWILVALFLAASAVPGQGQEKKPVPYESLFYPLKVGNHWRYRSTVGDNPAQKVDIKVDQQDVFDYKFNLDKKEITEAIVRFRLKVTSGSKEQLEHVAVLKDGVYRFTTAGKDITPPLRFLKLPFAQGGWTVDSVSENVPLRGTFTWKDESVVVPAGKFEAKRVSSTDFQFGQEKMTLDYWFAPNLGIVKQKVHVANSQVLLELEQFTPGK